MTAYFDELHIKNTTLQKNCYNHHINGNSIRIIHIFLGIFYAWKYRLYIKTLNTHKDNKTQGAKNL